MPVTLFHQSFQAGQTWKVNRGQLCYGGDWGKTFVGPPATAASRAALARAHYPNVVYHCMGATVQVTRTCWKSLDGGATWLGTAVLEEALALRAAGITSWSPPDPRSRR